MQPGQPAIKHWRTFGAADWAHVRDGALGLVLGSLLPVVLFYLTNRTWGFTTAVVCVLVWSMVVFAWHYRRTGRADVFSATTFGFACIKALAGVVSNNMQVYLAWPSLENMIYGTTFFLTALAGRPLLALYAQRLYPLSPEVRLSNAFRRAFLVVSTVWLLGHTTRAAVRLWLLAALQPQESAAALEIYLLADTLAGWPINAALVAFTAWYPLRQLRRAGFMSVAPGQITTMDAVELAVEESAPSTV
jgi:intracellular septation protein A